MTIEEAIEVLDNDLRRLKVQYDMFFAGSALRQPFDLRRRVDQLIRTFSNASVRNYSDRFRFNALVGRYNALSELWNKQLRATEEGRRPPIPTGPAAKPLLAAPQPPDDDVVFAVAVSDPEREPETMQLLYDKYLAARKTELGGGPTLKLESFVKQIAKQASSLRDSSGCRSIEFRVLRKGDAVSLKARPRS